MIWLQPRMTLAVTLVALLVAASGCQFRKSAFANSADEAGSEFAAAAETLSYFHSGKLTRNFAEASFVSYEQALSGTDRRLTSANGAPPEGELAPLLETVKRALAAVITPCLDQSCDWQAQVDDLRAASDALRKAAGES
jgi:hypothetical protein